MVCLPMWCNSRVFVGTVREEKLSFVAEVSEYWAGAAGSPLAVTSREAKRKEELHVGNCILEVVF